MFSPAIIKLFILGLVLSAITGIGYKLHHNGYESGYTTGKTEVQTKWDKERLETANAVVAAVVAEQVKAKTLQTNLDTQKVQHDKASKVAATRYSSLLRGMLYRPERPTSAQSDQGGAGGATATTNASYGCSGDKLFREDASAFIGFANDAESTRLELKSCIQQFETVRNAINSD